MSTPPFLPEWPEPGPALAIASINLAMAMQLAWVGLVLGNSGVRSLIGLGAHQRIKETAVGQFSTETHQASADAQARFAKPGYARSLAQRLRQFAQR